MRGAMDQVPEIAFGLAFVALTVVGAGAGVFDPCVWSFCCGGNKVGTTRLKLKSVENALRQYSIDDGYPSQDEGLAALVDPPGGEKPYLKELPRDAWNRPIRYFNPPRTGTAPFEVVSAGADGELGTDDDIYSSKRKTRIQSRR